MTTRSHDDSSQQAGPSHQGRKIAAGFAYGAISVALFSSFTLVSRAGLTSSLRPWDLAALRFGIGGLLLLPVLLRHGFGNVAPRDAFALAMSGGLGFAACAYAGFALAPATHGAILLHGTLPLSTFLLARVLPASDRGPNVAGLALIAIGVVAMAADGFANNTLAQWLGDTALLLASFSWSAYGLLVRRIGLQPAHSASIVAVLSMIASVPAFLALPGFHFSAAPWHAWLWQAVFQGVLVGAGSIFIYSKALVRLGPSRAAVMTAAVPSVTTLGAVFLLHEALSPRVLAGIALVTGGTLLSLFWSRRRKPSGA